MREKTVTVFESFDGQSFDTAAECERHERTNQHMRLVGLTEEKLFAAMNGGDSELAEALEAVGVSLRRKRQASGDLRRRSPGSGNGVEGEQELPPPVGREPMTAAEAEGGAM
jgi:hypothetical protein